MPPAMISSMRLPVNKWSSPQNGYVKIKYDLDLLDRIIYAKPL